MNPGSLWGDDFHTPEECNKEGSNGKMKTQGMLIKDNGLTMQHYVVLSVKEER